MRSREHWPVNWVDGMKINKSHFQAEEAFFTEQTELHAAARLTDLSYGLLPPSADYPGLDLVVTSERVELKNCRALTRGGHLLTVGPDNHGELQRRMSDLMYGRDFSEADTWFVLLRVHPGERISLGTPNPDEVPLRQPHTAPRLSLEVTPVRQTGSAGEYTHALPLARIIRSFQGIERDREYIPPVCRTLASDQLLQLHQHWKEQLLMMEGDAFEIIRKIKDKHRKNQGQQLSADLLSLTKASIRYVNAHFDAYRLLIPRQEPVYLIHWFMALARTIRNELRMAANQENMLNYMAHFIEGVAATDLMRFCNELCDRDYDHLALRDLTVRVTDFLGFITRLFAQLRQLDYHQIADLTIIDRKTYERSDTQARSPIVRPATTKAPGANLRITSRGPDRNASPGGSGTPGSDGGTGWGLD
ncbi:hypothetical protein [Lewinella sp. IMCC34183]|uniref:hypothetical protein n=1 Tax=Lewinella sp. IMCC34183 TaxID=2248762 RepID=UPI0013003EE6|nr:hypothetical protein [Lewinella sp. IMCC34183]